jgi:hypothetical protein
LAENALPKIRAAIAIGRWRRRAGAIIRAAMAARTFPVIAAIPITPAKAKIIVAIPATPPTPIAKQIPGKGIAAAKAIINIGAIARIEMIAIPTTVEPDVHETAIIIGIIIAAIAIIITVIIPVFVMIIQAIPVAAVAIIAVAAGIAQPAIAIIIIGTARHDGGQHRWQQESPQLAA